MRRWAVFVSGQGSNLQVFLDLRNKLKSQQLQLVISDRECPALDRARKSEVSTVIIPPKSEDQLMAVLSEHKVNHIFLLGYMRVLSASFLNAWKNPIINLHPSLLPHYKGLNAIRRAYDNKELVMGVTLHHVTAELDSGEIVRQLSFPTPKNSSFEALEAQMHVFEHQLVSDFLLDLELEPTSR